MTVWSGPEEMRSLKLGFFTGAIGKQTFSSPGQWMTRELID
ncbi:hypothetical protein [Laspinema olomoucense]|nr:MULTISPECIES: hypothetical protein [unclassified Laspinema]